jgi:ABC-2 type transport system permease protein
LIYLGLTDMGTVLAGYIGVFLLGLTYMSIGLWVSALTSHPAIAFVVTTLVLVLNSLIGQDVVLSRLPVSWAGVIQQLSLGDRVTQFYAGQISLSAVVYLFSVVILFTWLANKANEKNR